MTEVFQDVQVGPIDSSDLIEITTQLVSAYVSKNPVQPQDLAKLIADIHTALLSLGKGEGTPEAVLPTPAVNPKKSVFPNYIICLEDGKHFKSMKRHLDVHYGLSPEDYRQKWGLPGDYPMVAPSYSAARSALAKKMGLGQKTEPAKKAPAKGRRRSA